MTVEVKAGPAFETGVPKLLFGTHMGTKRAPMSSFLLSITHAGFEWLARLFSRGPKHNGIPISGQRPQTQIARRVPCGEGFRARRVTS
jgi:hypothetical protein